MSNQKAQAFMHSKKENVKRAQKHGSADGSKAPTSGGRMPRPGNRDNGSADQNSQGFFFGGSGGQHSPGSGEATPQDMNGGRQTRPQGDRQIGIPKGEVGTPFNGGQPPQFGGGGTRPQPTPGRGGRRPQPPGGRPGPGIPRGETPQFGSGPRRFGGDDMNYINR